MKEMLVYYFMQLLIRIHHMAQVKPHKKSLLVIRDMDTAVEYFRTHYSEQISIESYAADCNVNGKCRGNKKRFLITSIPSRYPVDNQV